MTILSKSLLGLALGVGFAGAALAEDKVIIIGDQCDRTGATQIVGTVLCPAEQDYYRLVNSKGGIDGWTIKGDE
ncbi:MAG TPA: hypothetical protein VGP52_04970, partial [Stellaceae bacterium]|nr:hypothetical protein [Stellaceae bacterium]